MRQLARADRLLLVTLLPFWLVCLGFHVKEVVRTGFVEPPVYAAAAPTRDGYPTVGGFRLERGSGGRALQVGDTLVQIGASDLRGRGYLSFDAIALAEAGTQARAPLVFERGGERREVVLHMLPSAFPWYRVVPIAAWVLVAVLILLRAPGRDSRLLYAVTLSTAILETTFYGGPVWQSYAALTVFHLMGGIAFMLGLRLAIHFPYEVPESQRIPVAWAALGALWWVVRIGYFVPTPIASDQVPLLTLGFDGLVLLAIVGIITRNYRRADPIGRRRVKWILLSLYLGIAPLGVITLLPLIAPGFGRFDVLFEAGVMMFVLVPLGVLIAVLRYNVYDVDRLISAAASYSGVGVVLLATALTLLPRLAHAASGLLGIDESTGQTAFSVLLALTVVPAHQRVRPRIERLFFRERRAIEAGIEGLMQDLSSSPTPEALARLAGERLGDLLQPECTILYTRSAAGEIYQPAFVRGRAVPPAFETGSLLISTLQKRPGALTAEAVVEGRRDVSIGAFERAALETLGVPLVLPIRRGDALIGFMCLGPKSSGDVYTSTDVALLTAVADKLSNELERFDTAQMLESGRAMQESLRRYVPGAIAEQLEAGEDLEAAEREVTVLFVDLRSYTAYSESRAAEEIFSTVNRYTDAVSRVVREHGGTVVEFNGDGMMAVFGAPRALADKECAAVRAACEMDEAVAALGGEAGAPLAVGIGVATGLAFVGNIRAVDRLIWSAIGNTTNLAARLQQLTRTMEASIVIDAPTYAASAEPTRGWRRHPRMQVRGRSQPIDLYSLPLPTREAGALAGRSPR